MHTHARVERRDLSPACNVEASPNIVNLLRLRSATQVHTEYNDELFLENVEYKDEADVREAFKHKPAVIDNILKSAHKIDCKVKGTLYAVPTYQARFETSGPQLESRLISFVGFQGKGPTI